jgi:antitoxin (DNA-binding transcriptional repressor) of toxin-antitoxin stability system
MLVINVQEPALDLAGLLRHMESGDEVVLARAGRLVARLAPYEPALRKQMKPGAMAGQIRMADDFDAPLDDLFGQGFDRLLVAQSQVEPLILLTADGALGPYGSTVRVI